MFAAEKKVISFKSSRKLFPDAKVSPFYITGEWSAGGMLVAVAELHPGDNFSNYYRMANGQSLCFSRADLLLGPRGEEIPPSARTSRSLREGSLREREREHNTGPMINPPAGNLFLIETLLVFSNHLHALAPRTRISNVEWGEETLQRSH